MTEKRLAMKNKFREALVLFGSNIILFIAFILTVTLPFSVLEYSIEKAYGIPEFTGFIAFIHAIFSGISIGAILFALSRIKKGRKARYLDSIAVGLRRFWALFLAQFFAGINVILGLLALVVPGIYLFVRYAMIPQAVVLEGGGTLSGRYRSRDLTKGIEWQIFGVYVFSFIGYWLLLILILTPFMIVTGIPEESGTLFQEVFAGCVTSLLISIVHIVIFLYYWEARERLHVGERAGPAVYALSSAVRSMTQSPVPTEA